MTVAPNVITPIAQKSEEFKKYKKSNEFQKSKKSNDSSAGVVVSIVLGVSPTLGVLLPSDFMYEIDGAVIDETTIPSATNDVFNTPDVTAVLTFEAYAIGVIMTVLTSKNSWRRRRLELTLNISTDTLPGSSDNAFSTLEMYDERMEINSSNVKGIFTINVILATSGTGVLTGVIG